MPGVGNVSPVEGISDQGTHFPIPLYRHQGTFPLFEVQCSQSFSKVCCKFCIPYPVQSNYNPLSLCTLSFENSLPNQSSEKNDKRTMMTALWSCSASTHSARPRKPLTKASERPGYTLPFCFSRHQLPVLMSKVKLTNKTAAKFSISIRTLKDIL
jgi:hypothetical protein